MKEVPGTLLVKSKSSNTTIKFRRPKGGNMSTVKVEPTKSKKRGVYVEKWQSPKIFEAKEIKRQLEETELPRPRPDTSTKSPAGTSKICNSTRDMVSSQACHSKTRKPAKISSPTTKFPRQSSDTPLPTKNRIKTNITTKTPRISDEVKTTATKSKLRSSALRQAKVKDSEIITLKSSKRVEQTESGSYKLNSNLSVSDHVHWSNIFPSDTKKNSNKLQEYIDNRLSVSKSVLNKDVDVKDTAIDETAATNEKDKQIYNFFKDLLDTVYDENLESNKITMVQSDVSDAHLEIEENVARKLYRQIAATNVQSTSNNQISHSEIQSNQRSLKVEDDQSQQLADYYNLRRTFLTSKQKSFLPAKMPRKTMKKATEVINCNKKPKKPNLLKLLKEELSNCNTYEEPENMYQALRVLAKRKYKRQISFDTPDKEPKSDSDRICRFQRRNVISRSTGLPRKKVATKSFIPTEEHFFEMDYSSTDRESNHTLEVLGFDYDDLQRDFEFL